MVSVHLIFLSSRSMKKACHLASSELNSSSDFHTNSMLEIDFSIKKNLIVKWRIAFS